MRYYSIPRLIFIFNFFLIAPVTTWGQTQHHILSVHETLHLDVDSDSPIEVSRGDILSVKDLGDRIQVQAKKRGSATLRIGSVQHKIEVVHVHVVNTLRRASSSIHNLMGLNVSFDRDALRVQGRLISLRDYETLLKELTSHWRFEAEIPADMREGFSALVQKRMRKLGFPTVSLQFTPQALVTLPPNAPKELINSLKQMGLNHQKIPGATLEKPTMVLSLIFLEIEDRATQNIGVRWPQETPLAVLPKLELSSDILVQLQHLEGRGLARRYAQPKITLMSGKPSRFHSGGEIPVKSTGFASSSVNWKPYGFLLEVKGTFSKDGPLEAHIQLEISGLDPDAGIDGLPGMKKKSFETHVFLSDRKPVLLGNFLDLQTMNQKSDLPFFQSIPLIGSLFRSQSFLEGRSKSYLLVVPET